jgi:Zn-finger domain-containing protein
MTTFDVVMPIVDHRICIRHLYANFRDIGGYRGLALKEQLWATVSSYTEYEFTQHMEELKRVNRKTCEFLSEVDLCT